MAAIDKRCLNWTCCICTLRIFCGETNEPAVDCNYNGCARYRRRYRGHRASGTGSVGSRVTSVIAGHECRARGRAERADMEIRETHGFGVKPIQIWRFENRIAVAGQIAIPLIISHHGFRPCLWLISEIAHIGTDFQSSLARFPGDMNR